MLIENGYGYLESNDWPSFRREAAKLKLTPEETHQCWNTTRIYLLKDKFNVLKALAVLNLLERYYRSGTRKLTKEPRLAPLELAQQMSDLGELEITNRKIEDGHPPVCNT